MLNLKKGKLGCTLALILGLVFSMPALAMEHGTESKPMEGGMSDMGAGQIMLGQDVEEGVRAMFHLAPAPRDGSGATHHLMVKLTDTSSRETITSGDVTVNVIPPEMSAETAKTRTKQYVVPIQVDVPKGKVGAPRAKMGMSGHFGTNVTLDSPGIWKFEIVTKLGDGKERTFDAQYNLK